MNHFCFRFLCFFSNFFLGILLLCLNPSLKQVTAAFAYADEPDHLALLDIKNQVTKDPTQILKTWNDSIHFCNWVGVTCNPSGKRVMILNLQGYELVGSLSPSTGNLTYLTQINLRFNNFHGEIPQEMGRLVHLQHLNISDNHFGGTIPTNLSHCTELRLLDVGNNDLIGEIPDQLKSLLELRSLRLAHNKLIGRIPPWIGNFSSLYVISLSQNNLEGSIPDEFGGLSHLLSFEAANNRLTGNIPPSLYNISSIFFFSVSENLLHGNLPPDIGTTLPNLEVLAVAHNNITGEIPPSFINSSKLMVLDFAENSLTGAIPTNFGTLPSLSRLSFDDNDLGFKDQRDFSFLTSLANLSRLDVLGFARNNFQGEFPISVTNLSRQLTTLTMGGNRIHGSIPAGIENLVSLTLLRFDSNFLTGTVPDNLSKLHKLEGLYLNQNNFTGSIPFSFGNLTSLTRLFLEENRFGGSIPYTLGHCQKLQNLNLSYNNLRGKIYKDVIGLSSLSLSLDLSHNSLTGSLPSEVGNLRHISVLRLSNNKLSGEIPSSIGNCIALQGLHLNGNMFNGTIPQSSKYLQGLQVLDVSHNNFSGKIPYFFGKLSSLQRLDLSFNNFEGEVPRGGIFDNISSTSLLGNLKLCSVNEELHLPVCFMRNGHSSRRTLSHRLLLPLIAAVILLALVVAFFFTICSVKEKVRRKSSNAPLSNDWKSGVSFLDLAISTNRFSVDNLIGSGSFGSVYKGVRPGDRGIVAVKVLNLQKHGASKSFIDECRVLRNIRHRNLLKIIAACSSIDVLGNDFKALVFPFMSNGSLNQWLHQRTDQQEQAQHHPIQRLSFMQRLSIAIDVASALAYLHHDGEISIVHCNLKPSNILIDDDMIAHVGDFGLAKFLFDDSDTSISQTLSAGLKDSFGYIPPEYGTCGQVTINGDVYSYGIVLLEMFTGKRPTDEVFKDGLSIQSYVLNALPQRVMDIVERSLIFEDEIQSDENREERGQSETRRILNPDGIETDCDIREECLLEIMEIGIICSGILSEERISMEIVVKELKKIREKYVRNMSRIRRNRR